MKYKLLLIALLFSVVGYGQELHDILQVDKDDNPIGVPFITNRVTTLEHTWHRPTGFTNSPPVIEYGTCVYLNRNDRIQITKQATRSTYTEYMEDGPILIASQEITYKTKYGINIPEDAVILFKIKPKK